MSPADLAPQLAALDGADPDGLYAAFVTWVEGQGLALYSHQDEAVIELLAGDHVILATPTGSGKSLVATAAIFAALSADRVSFYTAPIKALVSEKFFAMCEIFGADNVGMLTGDASVNADAPIICCTAEVLANIALREGRDADVGLVVMDEFHYYAEPERGWAWHVPLVELPQAQHLLMSATLGDMTVFADNLREHTGRAAAVVDSAERPVPLTYSWSVTPLQETIQELLEWSRVPMYVVHPTQAGAADQAKTLAQQLGRILTPAERDAIAARLGGFRFSTSFGRTLSALLRKGIGVHHAGMLPRYRRLVEQLAQAGLLKIICGTDTLGVGINVPIRTVLFTGLAKFDGTRERVLRVREFRQIAGRAGRAGFDTEGYVVVQAPEHTIENARRLAKAGDDPVKVKRVQRVKAPDGAVVWTDKTFEKLTTADPEPLTARMKVDDAMILNVVARPGDAVRALSHLTRQSDWSRPGGEADPRTRARLARRAIRLGRSLLDSGVLVRLRAPDATGRTVALTVDLPADFALNQPLAHFALAALDVLDREAPAYPLDVVSVVEAVLDDPRPVLMAQQFAARGEAVAEMKADGIEYEERMALLEEVTWPRPLQEVLEAAYAIYRQTHPWLAEDALSPKSVVREMWEQGMSFGDLVGRYQLGRSEGVVLRYLSDAYRTLRQTVPDAHRTEGLEEIVEWLGETVRQTDSSLVDEWEALTSGEPVGDVAAEVSHHDGPRPQRPVTANDKAFRAMVRQAVFRRVLLAARDDVAALAALEPADGPMDRAAWDEALGGYWADHDEIGTDADARGPQHLRVVPAPATDELPRRWLVTQTLADPAGDHDWVLEVTVDLDASDAAGEPVLATTALRRL